MGKFCIDSCRQSAKEILQVFVRDRPWCNGGSNVGNGRPIRSSERAFAFKQPSLTKKGPVKRVGRRGATLGMTAWCSA